MSDYPVRHLLFDPRSREMKARKILRILCDHIEWTSGRMSGESEPSCKDDSGLQEWLCLDIGCSSGLISRVLAEKFGYVVGLDVDADALARSGEHAKENLSFLLGKAEVLPFSDAIFDVVVCSQVYEHVSDANSLAHEVWRVLRPGGMCVFSGPNLLDPIERHYGLPISHWMPRCLADRILQLTGRGTSYEEHPVTYWALRRLLRDYEIYDYTVELILDPVRYYCTDEVSEDSWARRVPRSVWRRLLVLLPNYNWVLVKPAANSVPSGRVLWPNPRRL